MGVLLISHDASLLRYWCDEVFVLVDGELTAGAPEHHPRDGSPRRSVNLKPLDGRLTNTFHRRTVTCGWCETHPADPVTHRQDWSHRYRVGWALYVGWVLLAARCADRCRPGQSAAAVLWSRTSIRLMLAPFASTRCPSGVTQNRQSVAFGAPAARHHRYAASTSSQSRRDPNCTTR